MSKTFTRAFVCLFVCLFATASAMADLKVVRTVDDLDKRGAALETANFLGAPNALKVDGIAIPGTKSGNTYSFNYDFGEYNGASLLELTFGTNANAAAMLPAGFAINGSAVTPIHNDRLNYDYDILSNEAGKVAYVDLAELGLAAGDAINVAFTLYGTTSPAYAFSFALYGAADDDTATPEPATMLIFGLGMAGAGVAAYRRKKK